MRKPKRLAALCGVALLALVASRGQAQTLLSAWSFDNASAAFGGDHTNQQSIGSFSSTAATYGEQYTDGTYNGNHFDIGAKLSSNTALGAVFSGSNVYLSFSSYYVNGTYDENIGYGNDSAFGVGYNAATGTSTVNPSGSSGGAGSLLMAGGVSNCVDFMLTTTGYHNLNVSFQAAAIQDGNASHTGATIDLAYSIGGGSFVSIVTGLSVPGGTNFASMSVPLPTALENQSSFDLRLTANEDGQCNAMIDNFKLTSGTVSPTALVSGVLVNDGFNDGTRTAGTNPLAVSWYSVNGPGSDLAIVNDNVAGGINSGNALQVTPTAVSEGVVAQFPNSIALMDGQSTSLSFQFRFKGTTNLNQAGLLRFGLLDSRGTPTAPPVGTGDNDVCDRVDDLGYYATTNPGLASTTGTTVYRWGTTPVLNQGTYIGGNTPPYSTLTLEYAPTLTGNRALASTTAGASFNAGTTPHWATLTIARSGTSLNFSVNIDGQTAATGTETAPVTYVFDSVVIATGTNGGSGSVPSAFLIDNVQVNYGVIKAMDGFDGTRKAGANPLKMNWYSNVYTAASELTLVDDSAGIGSGSALKLTPTGTDHGFVANLPSAITLKSGDTATMLFDWRYTSTTNLNQAGRLRFGLYNTNGTKTTSDQNGTTRTDDVGYFALSNPGLASSTGTTLARETAQGSGGEITTGTSWSAVGNAGTSVSAGTTAHYAILSISRSGTTVSVSASVDGQTATTYTDSAPLTYTYSELAFSTGEGTTPVPPLLVDNVQVEYAPGHDGTYPGLGVYVDSGSNAFDSTWISNYSAFLKAMGLTTAYFTPNFCDGDHSSEPLHGSSNSMTSAAAYEAGEQWGNTTTKKLTPIASVPLANGTSLNNETATEADFDAIVAGTYDSDYNLVFAAYTSGKWPMIYLRLGWEQNDPGSAYAWYAGEDSTVAGKYAAAWKHVANLAHAYATANNVVIKMVWCPATLNYSSDSVVDTYPVDAGYTPGGTGDQYVDVVACDVYTQVYLSQDGPNAYYDLGTNMDVTTATIWATTDPGAAVDRGHWLDFPGTKYYGQWSTGGGSLALSIQLAQQHLKPLGVPETGSDNDGSDTGPVDDPVLPLYLSDRLSQAVAEGTTLEFVCPWDGGSGFSFTSGSKPNQLASWKQFLKNMAALSH